MSSSSINTNTTTDKICTICKVNKTQGKSIGEIIGFKAYDPDAPMATCQPVCNECYEKIKPQFMTTEDIKKILEVGESIASLLTNNDKR